MTWRVLATQLAGVMLLEPEPARDARGAFTRLSCVTTLAAHGVEFASRQTSLSRSIKRGTLRGLHFQLPPSDETKVVHCIAGTIFDVALDLRRDSPTFRQYFAAELSAENGKGVLIPGGCAHGMITLAGNAAVLYQIDRDHDPGSSQGVRWNDPAFNIRWPLAPAELSERDATWPDFSA